MKDFNIKKKFTRTFNFRPVECKEIKFKQPTTVSVIISKGRIFK